jgi:hypothetical protein
LLHDLKDNVENIKDSDIVDFAKESNFYESLHDDLMQSWMCVTASHTSMIAKPCGMMTVG